MCLRPSNAVEYLRQISERLRFSASWEPLGGSPEPPQLGPEIGGSGDPPSGSHDAESRSYSGILALKLQLKTASLGTLTRSAIFE